MKGVGQSVMAPVANSVKTIDSNGVEDDLVKKYTQVQKDLGAQTVIDRKVNRKIFEIISGKKRRRRRRR